MSFVAIISSSGPKPKMPKKELNRTYESDENLLTKLSKDNNIVLPPPLKLKYAVGKMIGDGNFAVVRLCKDKSNNEDYALKIIDKAKCKGKVRTAYSCYYFKEREIRGFKQNFLGSRRIWWRMR